MENSQEKPPVRKNLVLVHLESISNTILWQYRAELATVWRLAQQSRYFSRFYAGSTSTEMSMADVNWGMPLYYDHLPRFANPGSNAPYSKFWAEIRTYLIFDYGYKDIRAACNYFGRVRSHVQGPHGPQIVDYQPETLGAEVKRALAEYKVQNVPFVMSFNNNVPHMALDDDVTIQAKSFTDRFKLSYQRLDATVNMLLSLLAELGLWESTVIVLYGDHGDELWSHALTKGFCHCIAPYSTLVWTPLFIYDNGKNADFDNRLMSAIDVRETIIKMMFPGYTPKHEILAQRAFDAVPFAGQDVFEKPRKLAFSQNLFAMQLEYSDREQALTKSYGVSDGVYRLVVSTGGKRPKDGGMELYYERLDPTNSRNLLDFFVVGVDGDILSFRPPAEAGDDSDFARVFTPETVQHMKDAYQHLKKELRDYVRAKEAQAMQYRSAEYHIMPEHAFKQARKRIRRDYDE